MTGRRLGWGALAVGLLATAGLIAGGIVRPEQAAGGYIAALAAWAGVPLGALALLMGFRLAGGDWSVVVERPLAGARRTVPILALLFLPVPFLLPLAYPWARVGWTDANPVRVLYLDASFFTARLAAFLAIWVGLAWWLGRSRGALPAVAGILVWVPTVSLAGVDWLLSRDPGFRSAGFGPIFVTHQIVAAYAFALLVAPLHHVPKADCGVLGGLLLAAVCGWFYFGYMQYLVVWMGDLPHLAVWYIDRQANGWGWAWGGVVALNGAIPFLLLLTAGARGNPAVLKTLAAGILLARLVECAWFVLPAERIDGPALVLMTAAALAVGGLWTGVWFLLPDARSGRHAPGWR